MVQTRSMRRSKKQIYRSRIKTSQCRGKKYEQCRKKNGCKTTKRGKRLSYCRKSSNHRA